MYVKEVSEVNFLGIFLYDYFHVVSLFNKHMHYFLFTLYDYNINSELNEKYLDA